MRLGTVRRDGTTQAFRQEDGRTVYLPVPDVGALLAGGDLRLPGEPGPAPAPEDLATPVLRPGKILCAGLNFYDHAEEVGQEIPEHPTIFAKYATALNDATIIAIYWRQLILVLDHSCAINLDAVSILCAVGCVVGVDRVAWWNGVDVAIRGGNFFHSGRAKEAAWGAWRPPGARPNRHISAQIRSRKIA